jgi:predicted hydrocarbon binding protein/KaiC/GvpD/RAD55 family RecA-like ATPase
LSLNTIQSIPSGNLILLVGPPGSGKSNFCNQTVLTSIQDKPVIYVTTESPPSRIATSLEEMGLGKIFTDSISYVDSFSKTIGLTEKTSLVVEEASSENLVSLSIAIIKLQRKLREKFLLLFNSLTSPYLINGFATLDFVRKMLLKIAAQGNAVLVGMDEGCGKPEDLNALMSMANGIIRTRTKGDVQTFRVVKHPKLMPLTINVPISVDPQADYRFNYELRAKNSAVAMGLAKGPATRREVGDFVHLFWVHLGRWSGMLWDPSRFPVMVYDANKKLDSMVKEFKKKFPLRVKLALRLYMPKSFSEVKDMKRLLFFVKRKIGGDKSGIVEYLEDKSRTDEHYIRLFESDACWGFDNVGATLGLDILGSWAGYMKGYEKDKRDWNLVETKCVGLGHKYCEFKAVPGPIEELKASLEGINNDIIERIYGRLMRRLEGYLVEGKPLWDRPKSGSYISLHSYSNIMVLPAIESRRYKVAIRLGGVLAGKRIAEKMRSCGIEDEEAVEAMVRLLNHCKVGKVSVDTKVKIRECCESVFMNAKEPSCFFTTGFVNGFFSTVRDQHLLETKCLAKGDTHCEWEFR